MMANPALWLVVGGLLAALLPQGRGGLFGPRNAFMLALPLAALAILVALPAGDQGLITAMGLELVTLRIDGLSFVWALIFHIAAFLGVLYAIHIRDTLQQVATLVYAGGAIGAVLAGDLVTLFVWWEATAISSVFLILASRNASAVAAAMRYLIVQVGSGVLLLAGIIWHLHEGGSTRFEQLGLSGPASYLIFIAFGIKAAFPLLHNWLQDAYPRATVTGMVVLSAFTTKLAIYALARGFAGEELLLTIGAVMVVFPLLYTSIENDLRKMLAYSLNIQLGFMVIGVGIGTELAINGAAAHAFAHILYKALLLMAMGAVLQQTGTIKASDLGGLWKSMPQTAAWCVIGSATMLAMPMTAGFVSKSMTVSAVASGGYWWLMLIMLAGSLDPASIKVAFFSFFGRDSGIRCQEAPWNMRAAMAIAAFLCLAIGIMPGLLYDILPYPVDYAPYTAEHIATQLQLVLFAVLAFVLLYRLGWFPTQRPAAHLDSDWVYRRALPAMLNGIGHATGFVHGGMLGTLERRIGDLARTSRRFFGPDGGFARTLATGNMVMLTLALLALVLAFNYLQ